mmetsp:Transcript_26515/g.63123  ORF Transcript_26515/g.63123 Transcript_26515/m.63123 type:complete len:214 (-) Transcript_26515:2025-2666(-)
MIIAIIQIHFIASVTLLKWAWWCWLRNTCCFCYSGRDSTTGIDRSIHRSSSGWVSASRSASSPGGIASVVVTGTTIWSNSCICSIEKTADINTTSRIRSRLCNTSICCCSSDAQHACNNMADSILLLTSKIPASATAFSRPTCSSSQYRDVEGNLSTFTLPLGFRFCISNSSRTALHNSNVTTVIVSVFSFLLVLNGFQVRYETFIVVIFFGT